MSYLVCEFDSLDRLNPLRVVETSEEAELLANSLVRRKYDESVIYEVKDDGSLEVHGHYSHVPEPLPGPYVKAWISARVNETNDQGYRLSVHRCPIDCFRPVGEDELDEPLDEDYRYRCLATDYVPSGRVDELTGWPAMECACGEHQLIEGPPEIVASMVEEYPPISPPPLPE